MDFLSDRTIAAISTAMGASGIGIVRMSGNDSMEIMSKIFRPKNNKKNMNYGQYALFLAKYVKDNIVPRIGKRKNKKKKNNLKLEIK